jgi:hypothetical protein
MILNATLSTDHKVVNDGSDTKTFVPVSQKIMSQDLGNIL